MAAVFVGEGTQGEEQVWQWSPVQSHQVGARIFDQREGGEMSGIAEIRGDFAMAWQRHSAHSDSDWGKNSDVRQ